MPIQPVGGQNFGYWYWPDEIYSYIHNGGAQNGADTTTTGVYTCPDTADFSISNSTRSGYSSDDNGYGFAQGNFNNDPVNSDGAVNSYGYTAGKLAHVATTILFCDGQGGCGPYLTGSPQGATAAATTAANITAMATIYPAATIGGVAYPAGYSPNRPVNRSENIRTTTLMYDGTDEFGVNADTNSIIGLDRAYHLHNNATNYLFADGHVKRLQVTTMSMWTAAS